MAEPTNLRTGEFANSAPGKGVLWLSYVLSALPVLAMLLSCSGKLMHAASVVAGMTTFGFPPSLSVPIGLLELSCAVIYLIPRTTVLGAILVSCYLAAAFVTHLRILDPMGVVPVFLGVCAWGGLYFRDERIRALIPLRRNR